MGYKLFYLCSRNQGMRVKPIAQVSGGEGLVSRVLGCAEFFRILPWSGFEKKLQKFLLKSLEVMKKSLPLQPLSETKRTF